MTLSASLTDREREVATAIAEGKQNSAIAKELYMSEATVKTHITRTFAKLGVSNRVQLAIFAYQAGLLAS
ncbi:response regulator transcription factor [Haloechinothrix salitolerans]|uniref:Response regulator transcription factor n=1 Tax=Haloechinothrix salitolerans TaxID=926830 RepID=A0ABW2C8X1_9PSEU